MKNIIRVMWIGLILMCFMNVEMIAFAQEAGEVLAEDPWYKSREVLLTMALGLSEVLALIPGIKANSVFQFLWDLLKLLKPSK